MMGVTAVPSLGAQRNVRLLPGATSDQSSGRGSQRKEAQEWGSWQQPRKEVPLPSLDVGGAHEEGMLSKAEGWGALTEAPPGS